MPKLTYHCPLCEKQLVVTKEYQLGESKLCEYRCGHVFARDITRIDRSTLNFNSVDGSGKRARGYQEVGVEFILQSDFNCIIGDQMRLGKTPQALLALKNKYKERTPALILVRSANLWQWIREYKVWCDTLPCGIYPITSGKDYVIPGFSAYIVSMDTFSRPAIQENLKKIPFKLIIADEAHSFKNTSSNRSQALVSFVNYLNTGETNMEIKFTCAKCGREWTEHAKQNFDKRIGHQVLSKSSKCPNPACGRYVYQQQQQKETVRPEDAPCGVVMLTGTAIENSADELFIPLNIVNPEKYSSLERFRRQWLAQDSKGRYSRVKPYLLEDFRTDIESYYLRREKEDVYTDLPALNRTFTTMKPDKDALAKEYNRILDQLEARYAEKLNPTYWDMADDLMKLRRICGMMKVMWAADYLEMSALESSEKIAIGIHHKDVCDVLFTKLGGAKNCLRLSGSDNAEEKDRIMREWEKAPQQFLIINMLAGGVGMDFHYCDNVLVLERQWNASKEEQFEFRFYNPDKSIKTNPTNVEYIVAEGTIDGFLHDMVEKKRMICHETIENNWSVESNPVFFKDLMQQTLSSRL